MPNEISELRNIADRYVAFAADEARGVSEIYETLAQSIASSNDVLEFLATLPAERRQPNLFLAAVRHLFGVPNSGEQLVDIVRRKHEFIRELMLSRTTQTNEPARCAVVLPLLVRLPQPLALLEVGSSAGLCLSPIVMAMTMAQPRSSLRQRALFRRLCSNVKLVERCLFRSLCQRSSGVQGLI
jgi:hypothetical protein